MLALPILLWLAAALLLLLLYRRDLPALWCEPVLKRPLLIIESDDWGVGPASQAEALRHIVAILEKFRDREGRHPVVTLALVLATAGRERGEYQPIELCDECFADLREAITQGCDKKVFSLQLHGKEHFWPPLLLQAAARDSSLAAWMERSPEAITESLPTPLQSRWIDASVLPSRHLEEAAIVAAAREEVQLFERCFGRKPAVAVPPTFIWNATVERAWRSVGVEVVVTPGRRFDARDGEGRPVAAGTTIRNGERGAGGIFYVVRDDYFEPYMGHKAERALAALERKTRLARPTLLETHRLNFLNAEERERALVQLESLLEQALRHYPAIAFISTERLAQVMQEGDPDWIECSRGVRLHFFIERLWTLPRMRKLLWITTLMLPVWLLWILTGRSNSASPSLRP